MGPFLRRTCTVIFMASTLAGNLSADSMSEVVNDYIAAWTNLTRDRLPTILSEVTVFDADWGRLLAGETLARTYAALDGVHLELMSQGPGESGQVVLLWSATDAKSTWLYTDTLTFAENHLVRVDWKGQPAGPSEVAWAEQFIDARNSLDGERFRPFMHPGARVVGRTLPSGGYTVEGFIDFMKGLKGTSYERTGNGPMMRAKDGHLYYPFRVKRNPGATLVSGRDHLVRQNGLVTLFEGVY